jgi:hypothetical protein
VGDDGPVAVPLREGDDVKGLGEGADLVELDENRVRDPFLNAPGELFRVGDEQVVPNDLDFLPEP